MKPLAIEQKPFSFLNVTIIVAALGYFVDIYDLLLFSIVRKPSLVSLGVSDANIVSASSSVINYQMIGLLIGGILWGSLGDKKGRLSVLFGSIILYSIANIVCGFVHTPEQYAWARFVAGLGLAGELGAGITLVSELLPKEKRGIGTSLVAGVGLSGAVVAYFVFKTSHNNWRFCYFVGGGLGFLLLLLRISVAESGMFKSLEKQAITKGNFLMFFTNWNRFKKYICAISIGLPTWFCIGILINLSDKFAKEIYGSNSLESGRAVMFAYIAISVGDIGVGFLSQYLKSRKMALYICYLGVLISAIGYFSPLNNSDAAMYFWCGMLGFTTGFWAIFVTMGAEQFGTNLRATAATTIPNFVRGALVLMNLLFVDMLQKNMHFGLVKSALITGSIVMAISILAAYFTEETFNKDLDFLESES